MIFRVEAEVAPVKIRSKMPMSKRMLVNSCSTKIILIFNILPGVIHDVPHFVTYYE